MQTARAQFAAAQSLLSTEQQVVATQPQRSGRPVDTRVPAHLGVFQGTFEHWNDWCFDSASHCFGPGGTELIVRVCFVAMQLACRVAPGGAYPWP